MADDSTLPTPGDLAAYDLAPPVRVARFARQGVNNALFQVDTGAGRLVLKVHAPAVGAAALRYEHRLLAHLAAADLPFAVPAPIAARDGATALPLAAGWAVLMPHIDAAPLDPADVSQAALLGGALAELHRALAPLPPLPRPGRPLFGALFGYPPPHLPPLDLAPAHLGLRADPEAAELLAWWRAEAAVLRDFATGAFRTLPWQVCHNDPAPSNVLAGGGRIAALLDFEFACPAPRALDLAMALRMTMRTWESADPWPAAAAVLGCYTDGAALTRDEARALPRLIRLRSAIPVLWRLGRMETPDAAAAVLRGIGFLRNTTTWLERHGARLVEQAEALSR